MVGGVFFVSPRASKQTQAQHSALPTTCSRVGLVVRANDVRGTAGGRLEALGVCYSAGTGTFLYMACGRMADGSGQYFLCLILL